MKTITLLINLLISVSVSSQVINARHFHSIDTTRTVAPPDTTTLNLSIIANADDGGIFYNGSLSYLIDGESSIAYFGEFDAGHYYYLFTRFKLTSAIPSGATITSSTLTLYGADEWQWDADDAVRIFIEDASDATQVADAQAHPDEGSSARSLSATTQRWPATGGISWNTSGDNISPDISALIQALVNEYGGLAQDAYIQFWVTKDGLQGTPEELGTKDYNYDQSNSPRVTIKFIQ